MESDASHRVGRRVETLERYWAIYDADAADVPSIVSRCFTPDGRFESAALPAPLVGHAAIVERVRSIRDVVRQSTVTHDGPVQWCHDTARWCWSWTGPNGDMAGTDVVRFADDDRIQLLVVFAGHVPQ